MKRFILFLLEGEVLRKCRNEKCNLRSQLTEINTITKTEYTMKFFVPFANDEEQSERVYADIAQFVGVLLKDNAKRIYSIAYSHNGKNMTAVVGKGCDPYYQETFPEVIAIFKSNPYKICLRDRGVSRGAPILVNIDEVIGVSFFD